jgi:Cof subfamily protein (haloacid dehalogenase superfamily)
MVNKLRKKLLASDLDGTFLNSKGEVSTENRDAIGRAIQNDLEVVFVTGRPPRWLRGVADNANHYNTIIGANGAFIADLQKMEVIQSNPLETDALNIVVERIRSKYPNSVFAIERAFVGMPIAKSVCPNYESMHVEKLSDFEYAISPGYEVVWRNVDYIPVAPIETLMAKPDITKVLVKPGDPTGWTSDSWLAEINSIVNNELQTTHASEHVVLAEISALGITKATALQQIAANKGLNATDIVAVGDMPNDIPMLQWASESWAVANAHEEVLDITSNVLPHTDEHAVAHLIEDLINR